MSKKSSQSETVEVATEESPKKMPLYKVLKDGNGYEIKVANMDNPLICNRTRTIEIENIRKSNFLEPTFKLSNAYDPELGIFFGVVIGIDKRTGEFKWQRFTIGDRRTYDCRKAADAIEWAIVSRAPWLEGSPYQSGKIYYRVFDRDKEAQDVILKNTFLRKAMEIVDKMISIDDQMDMYRNFGRNPEGLTPSMLHAEIIKISQRNPKEFVDMWTNNNRGVVTIFNRCVATGLIIFFLDRGGWVWKDSLALGMSDQSAQQYIAENKTLLAQMDLESQEKDRVFKSLKNKMSPAEKDFFRPEEDEDPELIELRMEAKLYGIKDFMNMSKKDLENAIDVANK
jgi:hypothetical protein